MTKMIPVTTRIPMNHFHNVHTSFGGRSVNGLLSLLLEVLDRLHDDALSAGGAGWLPEGSQ